VLELTPAEVKQSLTGYGRAEKEQVGRMVRHQLALPREPQSKDALDALAVALAAATRLRWSLDG
jgi:crossover junction endodeoxyribonuclease RuvC